ncbi:MAG: hypothetical protein DME94_07285 [Verrucomicrobia bacterium]|nr:MAG: hypothetical protein DME94_07285 [Verrucomicrobiota bacterium]
MKFSSADWSAIFGEQDLLAPIFRGSILFARAVHPASVFASQPWRLFILIAAFPSHKLLIL